MGRFFCRSPRVYELLSHVAVSMRDLKILNAMLVTLRRIVKLRVDGCNGISVARPFLIGTHPIFNRRPPAAFHERKTEIYKFLSIVDSPDVEVTLLKWFIEAPYSMVGVYLEAISKLRFSADLHAQWANAFSSKMSDATPCLNEIMLGFLMRIVRVDHGAIDIDFLVSQLSYFLGEVGDQELGWRAALGTAILELCSFGGEMTEDVIQEILADYPFSQEFGKCEDASVALLAMLNSGKWDELKAAVAVSFTRVVTMSTAKLKKFDVSPQLRADMRDMALIIFREDARIRAAALEALEDKAILVRRFDALFGEA
jgi:hypothetical protein